MTERIEETIKDRKTIENMLRPITYVSWILGGGIARPGDWPKVTILISFVHFAICSTIVAYGVIDFFTFQNIFKSDMFKIMYYMNKAVCYVASYYYVLLGIRHYKKWPKLMKKFAALDRKIRRETSIDDRPVQVKQIIALIITFALGPLSLVSHAMYYCFIQPQAIYASDLLFYYTITQSLATNLTFDVIVFVIYRRFKIINGLIKQIEDVYTASWIILKLRRFRELYHEICGLVTFVNGIHGIHLLFSSANSFMMVVATLFRIYMGVVEVNYDFILINNIIWITYASQFALMCCTCTITCRESSKTGVLIHEVGLRNDPLSNKRLYSNVAGNRRPLNHHPEMKTYEVDCVHNEVAYFSSQLQHHKVAFSACAFFELNNALLQSFIGVITTYLIILIQFYHPERHYYGDEIKNKTDRDVNKY